MFEIGEKIVCVNGHFEPFHKTLYRELPREGAIYTVRDCALGRTKTGSDNPGMSFRILLEEIHNDLDPYMDESLAEELGFRSDRFAPITQITEEAEEEIAITEGVGSSYSY
jgi:hypothetical protein